MSASYANCDRYSLVSFCCI